MCCWNSARRIPDSGWIRNGNMCQPVSSPSVWRGSTNTSGYVPKNARQQVEVALTAGEVARQLAQLHHAERGA